MAKISESLSVNVDKITGKTEVLLRFIGGRGHVIRARSGIFIPVTAWSTRYNNIKTNFLDKDIQKAKDDLNTIKSKIMEGAISIKIDNTDKKWMDAIIYEFHHPESVNKGKTLLKRLDRFIDGAPNRLDERKGKYVSKQTIYQYGQLRTQLLKFSEKCNGGKDWELPELNKAFYDSFVNFLYDEGFHLNTVGKHIKNLKVVLNDLPSKEKSVCDILSDKHCKKLSEEVDAVYLDETELGMIENCNLGTFDPIYDKVRDWFLLLCWTGCRYSDLEKINGSNIQDGILHFRQTKTGDPAYIPIFPTVKKILEKYNGEIPKPMSNQKFNEKLKEVCQIAKINSVVRFQNVQGGKKITTESKKYELVSSHTGRRSFATNNYNRNVPMITIMQMTGHRSEASFLKYIKLSPAQHAKKMAEIWGKYYDVDTLKKQ